MNIESTNSKNKIDLSKNFRSGATENETKPNMIPRTATNIDKT